MLVREGRQQNVADRLAFRKGVVLDQVPDPGPAADGPSAIVGRLDPGKDAQQGGLAGPVRPDEADPLACPQVERKPGE
jgi:hypothetical protein